MSLLNRPSHGLPNVLVALHRCVLARGPMSRDRLLALCGPASATDAKAGMARKTLNKWVKLGLFELRDDASVRLAPGLPPGVGLPSVLRSLALRPENNQSLLLEDGVEGDEEADGQAGRVLAADFTRAVCWCLAVEPHLPNEPSTKKMWDDGIDILQQRTFPETPRLLFSNDLRWAGFVAWAPLLAFGWASLRRAIVVDPTGAVRDALPALFGDARTLAADAFVDGLALRIPVLDHGAYRREVEARMKSDIWHRPADGELSRSLSWALQRLEIAGEIELGVKSDTLRLSLTGPNNQPYRSFTEVTLRRPLP